MKTVIAVWVPVLLFGATLFGQDLGGANVNVDNQINSNQNTNVTATGTNSQSSAEGGKSSVSVNAFSNVDARTPPLTTFPPYLPYWTHGGWGTIKAYFPNGPTPNDGVYETTFDPKNDQEMRELRNVLTALPHKGPLEVLGAVFNDLGTVLGGVDMYHHGRGFEIADSIVRERRPERKPLLVFIDSNVDTQLLGEEGYAYVGKVSVEGDVERNWDHVYMAAVAEALPWDVDILLVSGGMKGVTVGSNLTFPSGAAGYSQANYSLSLFGAMATGITEGKGKAVLSAEAYRFAPEMVERRRIPEALYDRIRSRFAPAPTTGMPAGRPPWQEPSALSLEPNEGPEGVVPQAPSEGTGQGEQLLPPLAPGPPGRPEPNQPGQWEFNVPVELEPGQPPQQEPCFPGFHRLPVQGRSLAIEPRQQPGQPGQNEPPAPASCPTRVPPRPPVTEPFSGFRPLQNEQPAPGPAPAAVRPQLRAAAPPCGALQVQGDLPVPGPRPTQVQPRRLAAEPRYGPLSQSSEPPIPGQHPSRVRPHGLAAEPPCGLLQRDRTSGRPAGYTRPRYPAARPEPPVARTAPPATGTQPGIEVSRELLNMAGFADPGKIKYLTVR